MINDGHRPETLPRLAEIRGKNLQLISSLLGLSRDITPRISAKGRMTAATGWQPYLAGAPQAANDELRVFTIPLRFISVAVTPDSAFGGRG